MSGYMEGFLMFFLETILVPPIKFRPSAKGGDSVSFKKKSFSCIFLHSLRRWSLYLQSSTRAI